MPDFNLPGVSSNVDVKGIIDRLVKNESKKLDRLEEQKEFLNKEKSAWSTLGAKMGELQGAARSLHGFRSPFQDKIARSGDEQVVTATASRNAEPSRSTIKVLQKATAERILSDSVHNERIFEPALLKIMVGDRELEVNFTGGRLEDLARAINQQAGEHVRAKVTGDTPGTSVLVLETVHTGARNSFMVDDPQTLSLFLEIGLFTEGVGGGYATAITGERLRRVSGEDGYQVQDGGLVLEPRSSVELFLDQPVEARDTILLKVKVRAEELEQEAGEPPPSFPELRGIGRVTVEDVEVEGGEQVSGLEEREAEPEKEVPVQDDRVLGLLQTDGGRRLLQVEQLGPDLKEYTYRLGEAADPGSSVDTILFVNNNTGRRVEYRDLSLVDTAERAGAVPKNQVQRPQDAVVSIDGVRVQRESNVIEDALKGVTIEVQGESDREVALSVDYDHEKITGGIVSLIEKYNEVLRYINEHTNVVPGTRPEERAEAGVLTGETAVMGLKNKLQRIMMDPYHTDRGKELSLLAQIGISMGPLRSDPAEIRGGYLTVDEDTFVSAFERSPEAIKQLFGSDADKDAVIDSGVAYRLEQTLKGYTEPRTGVIAYRVKSMEGRINDQERKIATFNDHLEEYRLKLEKDFTLMQQSLHELEQTQQRIENFSSQFKTQ